MERYAYLIWVDVLNNHNKFYEIKENKDGSIDVSYGRVGGRTTNHHYSRYEKEFYSLLHSKTSKGYQDVTSLHTEQNQTKTVNDDLNYKKADDKSVQELIEMLAKSSREFMKKHYTVKSAEITQKMIDEAENDLYKLTQVSKNSPCALYIFNKQLNEIFTDIPRKMEKVEHYTAKTTDDFEKIIKRERDMLDNVKGMLVKPKIKDTDTSKTVLEAFGLDIKPVTYKEEDEIITHLGKDYNHRPIEERYIRAFKVENSETRSNYEQFKKDNDISIKECRLFYHGSKTENWWSIMKTGLSVNPDASVTGKMFGRGIYFASDTRKALNYMDTKSAVWNDGNRNSGFSAIYTVALGKCYKPSSSLGSSFNKGSLPDNCLSVYADKNKVGLKNDEYVVYDNKQCTIKYLVEFNDSQLSKRIDYTLDVKKLRNSLQEGFTELIRTKNGVQCKLDIDNLSIPNFNIYMDELHNRFVKGSDAEIYFNYDFDSTFSIDFKQNNEPLMYLSEDDKNFLGREMKKAFCESEKEWNVLMENAKELKAGQPVITNIKISQKINADNSMGR